MDRLLTVKEVAHWTGLKEGTVRRWILKRELPTVRLGRRTVRIREKDLEALVRQGYTAALTPGERKC